MGLYARFSSWSCQPGTLVVFLFLFLQSVTGELKNGTAAANASLSESESSSEEMYDIFNISSLRPEDQIIFDYDDEFADLARFDLTFDVDLQGFRLPEEIVPVHYDLQLRPIPGYLEGVADGDKWTVPGKVKISLKCLKNTSQITLHAMNLAINNNLTKVVNLNTSMPLAVTNQTFAPLFNFHVITLNESLLEGRMYSVSLDFSAALYRSRKDGVYFTEYSDPADRSKVKSLISTLFAPTQARKVFPCFDEPQMKATFSLKVGRLSNVSSLANMNRIASKPIDGLDNWVWDEYATTVPMSPYLLAFVISNFDKHAATYQGSGTKSLTVQSWADSHHTANDGTSYATEVTSRILPFFAKYLAFNYSLPKLDSVAMPKINYGGMESWGLIIYRESSFLYFANHSTEDERSKTTGLISHELAHQWFGNLVTFSWWSDIWLSEGLATYLQHVGVAELYPEFDIWSRFVTEVMQTALVLDASPSSHALHRPILNSDVIFTVFDGIAYNKGASVLRMMEYAFSPPVFQAGLQRYVNENAYKAVHQDALFGALQVEVEKTGALPPNTTVKTIMDTWTLQPGYPLISVSLQEDNTTIWIEQVRYDPDHHGINGSWWVPITVHVEGEPNFDDQRADLWLSPSDIYATVNVSRDVGQWVIINAASAGFYRVLYDVNLTESIQRQLYLDHYVFPASARCRIIDDYFTTAAKQYIPIETALNMVSYIGHEFELSVWQTVFIHFKRFAELLGKDNVHLKAWIIKRLDSVLALLEEEMSADQQQATPGIMSQRHSFLLSWACQFKSKRCVEFSTRMVKEWKEGGEDFSIPVGLRSAVYCTVASEGTQEHFEFLSQKYQNETNEKEKLILLEGLSCARDMNKVQRELMSMTSYMLDNSTALTDMEESKLKVYMKGAIAHSASGRNMSWAVVQNVFEKAADMQNLDKSAVLGEIVSTLGDYWKTNEEKTELENFVKMAGERMNGNGTAPSLLVRTTMAGSFQTALEKVETNMEWAENFHERVQGWFEIENYFFPDGFITK